MFEWLWHFFDRRPSGPVPPVRPLAGVRVAFDPDTISLTRSGGPCEVLTWAEIVSVGLVSGDADSDPPDLYWLLQARDRRRALFVPMGAPGEHELVHEMQVRLQGFDNMAVVEAMSSEGSVGFTVWDESWPRVAGGE